MESLPTPPPAAPAALAELRATPPSCGDERIYGPFDAWVRGEDAAGVYFEGAAALDEVSAADFTLCLPRPHAVGARLFAVVRLGRARVALRGLVVGAQARGEGCLVRVSVTHHRFLG